MEDLFRQQIQVHDEEKETMLSYYSQFNGSPRDIYTEISTSDIKFPTVKLSPGEGRNMTSGSGNDFPIEQLEKSGVGLSKPETINAVAEQMNNFVSKLEEELKKIKYDLSSHL